MLGMLIIELTEGERHLLDVIDLKVNEFMRICHFSSLRLALLCVFVVATGPGWCADPLQGKQAVERGLAFLQKDHPEACKFLLQHELTLETCLADPKLLGRARHRPAATSRLKPSPEAGNASKSP